MIMRELAGPLGFTPEQEAAADELLPGWRELDPAEFMDQMHDARRCAMREAADVQKLIGKLESGGTLEAQ